MTFQERLAADAGLCEVRLLAALAGRAEQPVTDAMRYAVMRLDGASGNSAVGAFG